ncbi:hypothetical protein C8F01DRAFT_269355 [Mycena amicta]|nr:hypothetical protein C8F01DRAFT_269355 [Mycena amicta]
MFPALLEKTAASSFPQPAARTISPSPVSVNPSSASSGSHRLKVIIRSPISPDGSSSDLSDARKSVSRTEDNLPHKVRRVPMPLPALRPELLSSSRQQQPPPQPQNAMPTTDMTSFLRAAVPSLSDQLTACVNLLKAKGFTAPRLNVVAQWDKGEWKAVSALLISRGAGSGSTSSDAAAGAKKTKMSAMEFLQFERAVKKLKDAPGTKLGSLTPSLRDVAWFPPERHGLRPLSVPRSMC